MGRTGSVVDVVHTPPDDTFTFLTDVHRFCDWNAIMTRLVERSDTLAPGAEWVVEFKALGNTWP